MDDEAEAGEPHRAGREPEATRILFVCTANRCRSVMAEALARRRFAGSSFEFGSAGLLDGGHPMPGAGIQVAAENGIDTSGHRSVRVDTARLQEWDLVLTMTREHERELVAVDPALWPRVFTLPQFARWLDETPLGRHASIRSWVELLAAGRPRAELIGSRAEDEIADPVDGPPSAWRALVRTLTSDLDRIAAHLLPWAARSDVHPAGDAIAEVRAVEELRPTPARGGVHREGALHRAPELRRVGGAE